MTAEIDMNKVEKAVTLKNEGKSVIQIAKEFGVTRMTIYTWLSKAKASAGATATDSLLSSSDDESLELQLQLLRLELEAAKHAESLAKKQAELYKREVLRLRAMLEKSNKQNSEL